MKNIVILGAGTGGALTANMLCHRLDLKEWAITVIDRAGLHVYQPGLLFLPFGMYGYDREVDVVRPIDAPLPRSVGFVNADIRLIDHAKREVETSAGRFPYDFLVCALGCRTAPEEVAGMADEMGRGVHTFYTLDGALAMRDGLESMREGRLVIDICEMPIKCPVAPLEFAFLADYYFLQKGVRDRIEISLVTPYTGAFTKPNANRILSKVAEAKGIKVVPNFAIESVDVAKKSIRTFDGRTVDYDLLCAIPPNLGPAVIDDSGLGDGAGYGMTDPRTLKSRNAERIYLLGDNTNVATSKAGSVAHFEAETVVENLLREIDGKVPLPSFDGHANCFVETGHHKAMLLDFNYDIEPLEGSFPLPYAGPFSLLEESYMNHMGKLAFKWVYWNMLLPGHLPHVPLLPSHMTLHGQGRRDRTPDPSRETAAREGRDDQGRGDGAAGQFAPRGRGADRGEEDQRVAGRRRRGSSGRHPHRGRFPVGNEPRGRHRRRRPGDGRAQAACQERNGHDRRRHHDARAGHDRRGRHARTRGEPHGPQQDQAARRHRPRTQGRRHRFARRSRQAVCDEVAHLFLR